MAEINIFHYRPGISPLHKLDPRLKILLLCIYIGGILSRPVSALFILTPFLLWGSGSAGLKLRYYRRELKVFAVLGGVIFISRYLNSIAAGPFEAALEATVHTGTFLLVVWSGILLTAVLDPDELYTVVHWILSPLPGPSAGRIAARTGMTLVLVPLLLDTVHEIREARRARGIEARKNPIVVMSSLINPLMENLMTHMEEFSMALEARCFDDQVVRKRLNFDRSQLLPTLFYLLPPLLLLIFPLEVIEINL